VPGLPLVPRPRIGAALLIRAFFLINRGLFGGSGHDRTSLAHACLSELGRSFPGADSAALAGESGGIPGGNLPARREDRTRL
jgi:hypothetical protein